MARVNPLSVLLSRGQSEFLQPAAGNPTCVYLGQEIPCTPNTLENGLTLTHGGKEEEIALTLLILKDDWQRSSQTADSNFESSDSDLGLSVDQNITPPQAGKKVKFDQRWYRIIMVKQDGAGCAWKINLASANR